MTDRGAQPDANALLEADGHARSLGVSYHEDGDDWYVQLAVDESHTNFLGMAHGSVIFGLADVALSLVSNAEQSTAFAVDASISFVRAAREGDVLVARARPVRRTRTLSWFSIDVTTDNGDLIAGFSGTVYRPNPH